MISRTLLALCLMLAVPCVQAATHKKHSAHAKVKSKSSHAVKAGKNKKSPAGGVAPVVLQDELPVAFPGLPAFIDEMVLKYQFDHGELEKIFKTAQHRPNIIKIMDAPFTKKPWLDYRANVVNPIRISGGLKFIAEHRATLERAEAKYGVPQEIIVALLGIETVYGRNMGNVRTLDALSTLAFDYPRRAEFFRNELVQYLLLTRERHFDVLTMQSSFAGALGIPQFMPSNYRKYGLDFDENGEVDLLHDPEDVIGSVANYVKKFGWQTGEPVIVRATVSEDSCLGAETINAHYPQEWAAMGIRPLVKLEQDQPMRLFDFAIGDSKEFWLGLNNFAVLKRYNMSTYYAMAVYQLAEELHSARTAKN